MELRMMFAQTDGCWLAF